jgi:hypothetical protein
MRHYSVCAAPRNQDGGAVGGEKLRWPKLSLDGAHLCCGGGLSRVENARCWCLEEGNGLDVKL